MIQLPCIVLDIETTGLPERPGAAVIELGAVVLLADGTMPFAFTSLVRPSRALHDVTFDAEAMAVHGIDRDDIERAPVANLVDLGLDLVYRHALDTYSPEWPLYGLRWTSWNRQFDAVMLQRGFPRVSGWPAAPCIRDVAQAHYRPSDLPPGRHPSLSATARALGVPVPDVRHRALQDAQLAAGVLHALVNRAPDLPLEVPHAH